MLQGIVSGWIEWTAQSQRTDRMWDFAQNAKRISHSLVVTPLAMRAAFDRLCLRRTTDNVGKEVRRGNAIDDAMDRFVIERIVGHRREGLRGAFGRAVRPHSADLDDPTFAVPGPGSLGMSAVVFEDPRFDRLGLPVPTDA